MTEPAHDAGAMAHTNAGGSLSRLGLDRARAARQRHGWHRERDRTIFILWVVETMLIGPSRFRTEMLLVMTLGLVILPAVVIVSIVSTTFRRAAETVAGDASRNA
jgi:hypothetical protein